MRWSGEPATIEDGAALMKLFTCQACQSMLFFENRRCESCGHELGYLPDLAELSALEPDGDAFTALAEPTRRYRLCANAAHDVCNWLVEAEAPNPYCAACCHNRTIPKIGAAESLERWRKLELAKHRLFYSLIRLGIPLPDRAQDPVEGLVFDFLEEMPGQKVMTGHDNGIITIAAKEADDGVREELRHRMHESYRTLLGHFRHEVGHWIWDRLVRDGGRLEECRALFGDDTLDYQAALNRHYQEGPPADWGCHHISAYATTHPWEDFAETWAHYLHIMDTLETGSAFGISVRPVAAPSGDLSTDVRLDPYLTDDFGVLLEGWLPLVFAVNSLNRSMGLSDLYPFVISDDVRRKLAFMHGMARGTG